jgi:superfamily II DNA/RNA helicase
MPHSTIENTTQTPDTISQTADSNAFQALGLHPDLLQAVQHLGFTQPTTVQSKVIPKALPSQEVLNEFGCVDLMVSSQTGSGKTAAFLLPLLDTLIQLQRKEEEKAQAQWQEQVSLAIEQGLPEPKKAKRKNPTNPRNFKAANPRALILCPTRELAQQVAADAIALVRFTKGVRIASVIGGLPYAQQIAKLQNANLVVATPGRLLDLEKGGQITLNDVQFLVVDEADRMLDLGFADDLEAIHQLTSQRGQTMMFSATFAPRIQGLATRVMREPERIEVHSAHEKHDNIKQILHWADNSTHKKKLLDHWLRDTTIEQAIVFSSTQIECDALAEELQGLGFSAMALHGALSQGMRNRRLGMLRDGRIQILVATDVAARGIDVPSISHVFNYGLPMKAEDYTHRIGRTGRAGRNGIAVTFADVRDKRRIFDVEAFTKQKFDAQIVAGLEPQMRSPHDFKPMGRNSRFGGGGAMGHGNREHNRPSSFANKGRNSFDKENRFAPRFNEGAAPLAPNAKRGAASAGLKFGAHSAESKHRGDFTENRGPRRSESSSWGAPKVFKTVKPKKPKSY